MPESIEFDWCGGTWILPTWLVALVGIVVLVWSVCWVTDFGPGD